MGKLTKLLKEHDIDNLIFTMPLSYDGFEIVECISKEDWNRKAKDNHKITLQTIKKYRQTNGFFGKMYPEPIERDFYIMDFESLMNMHPEDFSVRFIGTDIH